MQELVSEKERENRLRDGCVTVTAQAELSELLFKNGSVTSAYVATHRERFLDKETFKSSLGAAWADRATLKESGTLELLERLWANASNSGRMSFYASTNLPRNPIESEIRRRATSELSASTEARAFIKQLVQAVESYDQLIRDLVRDGPTGVGLKNVRDLKDVTHAIKQISNQAPKLRSPLLNELVKDISATFSDPLFEALSAATTNRFENHIVIHGQDWLIPRFSERTISATAMSGWVIGGSAILISLFGLVTPSPFLTPGEFGRIAGASLMTGPLGGFLVWRPGQHASKFGQAFIPLVESAPLEIAFSAAGLLEELRVLSELTVNFPDKTSYPELTSDDEISITQMRHPLMCLTQGSCVPSDVRLKAGVPLVAVGQNGGGKTTFDQALIQNDTLVGLGAAVFGTSVRYPAIRAARLQVPERSKGASEIGRLETECKRTRSFAESDDQIIVLNFDEPVGGTSREEASEVLICMLAELAAKGKHVVVIYHDYGVIHQLAAAGLIEAVMPELDSDGNPTFRIIPCDPERIKTLSSGGARVLEMTELSSEAAISRLTAHGGDVALYNKFRELR